MKEGNCVLKFPLGSKDTRPSTPQKAIFDFEFLRAAVPSLDIKQIQLII
jgi:hypothetical protein